MAETCIVCLGDLAGGDDRHLPATDPSLSNESLLDGVAAHDAASKLQQILSSPKPPTPSDEELVAHLLPCGHNLHNECLKPWVERANSCPICRASFNMVELSAKLNGPLVSSYAVQDKQQVADLDPSMIIEEDDILEDDGSYEVCMVCDEFGNSTQLMYCFSCEQLCHVFCAGLDVMPSRGPWYCQQCMENPQLLSAASRRPPPINPSAYVNGRSRVRNRDRAPDEWVGVWRSVWDRLHFDIEFPFDDDEQSDNRSEVQRRENQEWERRFELARRMGAGHRFRATNNILHRREAPKTPKDPESQEELRAWNLFEKAKEELAQQEDESADSTRRRKRKSRDSSPIEPEIREPERKLKRPRTRIAGPRQDVAEASASASASRGPENHRSPPIELRDSVDAAATPGFLQSLLQEVQVDRHAEDKEIAAPQPKRIIVERACSPQNSSPGLSPVYPTPHGPSTPPPLNLTRPAPQHQSSPQLSPTYSPYSPADDEPRSGRRKHKALSPGLHSPPRSKDSSPSRSALSYSTKSELQRMVTVSLKPLYLKKEITKDEYTDINKSVSHLLYDRVGGAGATALADQGTRERWQKMAGAEVENAVRALRITTAADDSASSSS